MEKDHPEQSEWVFRSDGEKLLFKPGGVKPLRRFCSTFEVKSGKGPFPGKESDKRCSSFPNGS
jgi:hypothetical protein